MKSRLRVLGVFLVSAALALLLGSCEISLSFDGSTSPTTIAEIVSAAAYQGGISPGPSSFPSWTATRVAPSFWGSSYYSLATSSYLYPIAYSLTGQAVTIQGATYYLYGTLNFAYGYNNLTGFYAAYVYSDHLTVGGSSYLAPISIDLSENFTASGGLTSTYMNAGIAGWISGQYLSTTAGFWF